MTQPATPRRDDQYKRWYLCLYISVIVITLSVAFASILEFYNLEYYRANETAFHQYLHRAMDIKREHSNTSILDACHQAIEHDDIQQLYQSANVELQELEIDIESLKEMNATNKTNNETQSSQNKKYELILLCGSKLSFIKDSITQSQQLQENAERVAKASKQHREAYQQFLEFAITTHRQNPNETILEICIQSIDHADLQQIWQDAEIDVTAKVAVDEIMREQDGERDESDRRLTQKEKLVILCEIEVTMIFKRIEYAIRATEASQNKQQKQAKELNLEMTPHTNNSNSTLT